MTARVRSRNRRALLDAKKAAWELTVGTFRALLKREGIEQPVRELRFAEGRRFAFDFAWEAQRVVLEVDGGIWTQGRHSRGSGILKEHEKFNLAAIAGWRVLRCTPDSLCDLDTAKTIRLALSPLSAGGER